MLAPPNLTVYVARRMLAGVGMAFAAIAALIFLLDAVELARRVSRDDDGSFALAVGMAALHLPYLAQRAIPYVVLVGALLTLARLSRDNEAAAISAAGASTPQLLFPCLLVAVSIGAVSVTAFGPLASGALARFYELDNKYLRERASGFATPRNGLWLREPGETGAWLVHAAEVDPRGALLRGLFILRYRHPDRFEERIDAAAAEIRAGHWLLRDASVSGPGRRSERHDTLRLDTDLTVSRIQDSFAAPETQSFWDIPEFVATLDRAGFSSLRHRLHWHAALASPLALAGMVLIAALFGLRPARARGTGPLLAVGAACGFAYYIFSDVVTAYGLNGRIPYVLAAWAPAATVALIGSGLLLHGRRS